MNNNAAESYNSVICKFVGGKRINFALKGSYKTRCEAALISFNSKGQYHKNIIKTFTHQNLKLNSEVYFKQSMRKYLYMKKRRLFEIRKKQPSTEMDNDYGLPSSNQPDMPDELFEERKESHLKTLQDSICNRLEIEKIHVIKVKTKTGCKKGNID